MHKGIKGIGIPPIYTTKYTLRAIRAAEKKLNDECLIQTDLGICSMAVALARYWNFKPEKIAELVHVQEQIYQECADAGKELSMIQKCDQECDIELTNHEGVSYRDCVYLNGEIEEDGRNWSGQQWLAMRLNQIKWVEAQIMACIFIALHRSEGWSFNRLSELGSRMADIKAECNYDTKIIKQLAYDQADFNWVDGKVIEETGNE
jgi:hypothetical protein